jgi:tRNA pseudouridine55 synthase
VIDGILPVDKPAGWTSHDVVARVRRIIGQRQVGHAGTLDPLATGVLVLVLGSATRLSSYLMDAPKIYCAEIVLGATTVTDDAEAPLLRQVDPSHLVDADVAVVLARYIGHIDQVPPAYAAIKRGGQKLYELARQGIEIEPVPRQVTIEAIDLLSWNTPRLRLRVRCAAGTYIRALARDIGASLGVGGYLHGLRRIASGSFTTRDTAPLAQLTDVAGVAASVYALDRAVLDLPAAMLDPAETRQIRNGQMVTLGRPTGGTIRLYGATGSLVALGECRGNMVQPVRVFEEEKSAGRA